MSERTTVTVQDQPDRGRYEAVDEAGVVAGFSEYRRHDGQIVVLHTEVDDAYEGRGVGSTLAREVIEQALAAGLGVVVSCPFVKAYVERHPELAGQVSLR